MGATSWEAKHALDRQRLRRRLDQVKQNKGRFAKTTSSAIFMV